MAQAVILAFAFASLAAAPLGAASVRTIATVVLDTWFDGSFRSMVEDVTLVSLLPKITLEARLSREDTAGWHGWQAGLGPVVNLTPNLYLVALYNLGVDSDVVVSHEIDASLNHETATTAVSLGLKADWLPSLGYLYATSSLGGKFHPVPALGLFGKAFVTVDGDGEVSGSFWGEADWRVSRVVTARAGGTMGYSGIFGWSATAGVDVAITPRVLLKYTFTYLAAPVDGLPGAPVNKGVENGIVLDVRF